MAADSREVFLPVQTRVCRDSKTSSDRARQGAAPTLERHEIRSREGLQTGLKRFIIKSLIFILFDLSL
jgi:hypothetical protein